MNDTEEFNSDDEYDYNNIEKRYCRICRTALEPHEIADICWNCQASMLTSGMV